MNERKIGHLHAEHHIHPDAPAYGSGAGSFRTRNIHGYHVDTVSTPHHDAPASLFMLWGGKSRSKPRVAHQPGIRIHAESKISAETWLQKITDCQAVPDYFWKQVKTKGQSIFIPKDFKVPGGVIKYDWPKDWLSAFAADTWEVTTASFVISVKKGNAKGPVLKSELIPDLSSEDEIDDIVRDSSLRYEGRSLEDENFKLVYGATLAVPTVQSRRRSLIAVATRGTLSLGDKPIKNFVFLDSEIVRCWFHEIACHAGPYSLGQPYQHDDKGNSDSTKSLIDSMIPGDVTFNQVIGDIKMFLKPPK